MTSQLVTGSEAVREFNLSHYVLHVWRTRGCPALGPLSQAEPAAGWRRLWFSRNEAGRYVYKRDELRRAIAPLKLPEGTLEDARGVWLTFRRVEAEYGHSEDSLKVWREKGCTALAGRKLRAKQVVALTPGQRGPHLVWVYLQEDLESLSRVAVADRAAAEATGAWMGPSEAKDLFHFSAPRLWVWSEKGCPALGGRKLRSRQETRRVWRGKELGHCSRSVRVYSREDLQAAWDCLHPPAAGDAAEWLSPAEVEKRYGHPRHRLAEWRDRCVWLGGRPISTRPLLTAQSHGRVRKVLNYARADLDAIERAQREGRSEAVAAPSAASVTGAERVTEPRRLVDPAVYKMRLEEIAPEVLRLLKQAAEPEEMIEATPGVTGLPSRSRVIVGTSREPVYVDGKAKDLTFTAYKVVKALAAAGEDGLSKGQLEAVSMDFWRILDKLRKDEDWKPVIHFPGMKGGRYRIG